MKHEEYIYSKTYTDIIMLYDIILGNCTGAHITTDTSVDIRNFSF